MPILGTPNSMLRLGGGVSSLTPEKMMNDLSSIKRVSGMVVPQIQKVFTENVGHSGNLSIPHPADTVDLAKMILPRGGSRVQGQHYKISQFKYGETIQPPAVVGSMYEYS